MARASVVGSAGIGSGSIGGHRLSCRGDAQTSRKRGRRRTSARSRSSMPASASGSDIGKVKVRCTRATRRRRASATAGWRARLGLDSQSLVNQSEMTDPVTDAPLRDHRPRPAAPRARRPARPGHHARRRSPSGRPVHGRPGHRPARPARARAPDPARRHRRPAQRDLPRLAVQRPGRRRRRAPAPGELDGRLPQQLRDRRRGRPVRPDADDRGLEPGRPWIVRQAAARGGVVYRAAGRVQPPRPTDVGRLTHRPAATPSARPDPAIRPNPAPTSEGTDP